VTEAVSAPAPSRTFVRDVALVARFELAESLRSKLLVVMVLLFVGAGALGAWGYTELLGKIEANAAKVTGAPTTRRPGAVVRRFRDMRGYRDLVRMFSRDDAQADYFAAIPPIVLFFGWVTFTFTPWLVLFTSAETIATEVASRSIRYSALRTGRLEFALGKAAGQALIIVGVTALSALMFYLVAWASLDGFEHGATTRGLLAYWPRVVLYTLPFLGWAMLASMLTSSANLARIVSLGGAVVLAIVWGLVKSPPRWLKGGPVFESIRDLFGYVTPFGHYGGLIYPPGGELASDVTVCLALTVLYFAAGYAVLRRRDL
jgi:ABC-type transport system involved in multi-copper enzyme maturation permease subunit